MLSFIQTVIRFILPLIVLIMISGCTNELEVRKAHWEEQLKMFDPVGKEKDSLLNWLSKQDIESHTSKSDLAAVLEDIEGDGIVCSKWSILLSAKLDNQDFVRSYALETHGHCL